MMCRSRSTHTLIGFTLACATLLAAAPTGFAQTGLDFDGSNDYVTFGQAPSLGLSSFTLETWLYRDGSGATVSTGTGGVTAVPLITKGRGEADGDLRDMNYFLGIRGTDSVLVADFEEGTGQTTPGLNHPVVGTTPIRRNTWYHAAATFDGTTWRLYLNGNLEAELNVGANRLPQSASTQHAALGSALQSNGTPSGYFAGVLDEARVWSYARPQQSIIDSLGLELTSGPGLIGRWGLNEGAGATAFNSVPGGVDGTLTNGPVWVTGSPFDLSNSIKLGASSAYVTFGDPPALDLSQFTIETWFRRDGAGTAVSTGSGGITAIPLVTKGAAEADGSTVDMNYFLGIRSSDNVLAADFEEGSGGATPGLNHPIVGVTAVVTGQWYHAAATYDGTTWKLYLNGQLESQLSVGQPPQSSSVQHAGLGTCLNSTGTPAGYFNGTLDEARVWNYARTGPEVNSTINDQIEVGTTGLVGRWGLDEGAGTAVRGSAGTTVNGTITGTGWTWTYPAPFDIQPPAPPAAPFGLTATAISYAEVDLSWTDGSTNELRFEIERSSYGPSGPFTPIDTVDANVTTHADFVLDPQVEYCYRVRASNNQGASAWADVACDATLAETPHALDFGGTDGYVTFGAAPALGASAFTIETWFRRDGGGVASNTGTGGVIAIPLVTKGRGEAEGGPVDMNYFLGIRELDGVLVGDFEADPSGQNYPVAGVTPVAIGTWQHAAATYDGTTWRLYLNGVLETQLTVNATPQSGSIQHAALASALNSTGVPQGYLDGVLDETRIWDHARTLAEIQGSINDEIAAPQSGLLGRWSLNEGAGTRAFGSAATTTHGILQGSNWIWTDSAPFDIVIDNPPDEPVLNQPENMATNVALSPTLDVTVSDPEESPITVTFYGRPAGGAVGPPFSLLIIPDTQYYSASMNGGSPEIFRAETRFAVDSIDVWDFAFIAHVGDIVESGDTYADHWDSAFSAIELLEDSVTTGLPEGLPYSMAIGNHDQSPAGDPAGTTIGYNTVFGTSHFAGRSYYGGAYGADNDNHFSLFSAGGLDFVVITLEYGGPNNPALLAWADSLLQVHATRWGIVNSHNLLGAGNPASFSSQGTAVYNALKANPNLFLMVSGHVPGEGRRSDTYNGRTVHTVMADYQSRANGGDGWVRIMTVDPAADAILVKTYSATLDSFETDADSSSQFTLPIDLFPLGGWQLIGTVANVPSGSNASATWPGLAAFTEYEWYVTVSDGNQTITGPTWTFTTGSALPTAQVIAPNGGDSLAIGSVATLRWTATDDIGVTAVDLQLSRNGSGGSYESVASGLPNTGSHDWMVTGPATADAFLKVVVHDEQGNTGEDTSDAAFTVFDPATGVQRGEVTEFALALHSVHPVNGPASLSFAVPKTTRVRLSVFDVSGRVVAVLADGVYSRGRYPVVWSGETGQGRSSSGVYFLRLQSPEKELTKKLVMIR